MLKRTIIQLRKSLLLALMATLSFVVSAQNVSGDKGFEIAKNLEIFANIYKNIHVNYVDDVDPGKTIKVAIDAMLASLDPYTNYFPESDIEDVKLQLLGEYGGVGALIHQQGDSIFVSEPYEGLPAQSAGIRAGDRIVEVNGESTKGKSTSDVSSAMRGQAGTPVSLKLERDGKLYERTLTRQAIKLPNVPYSGFVDKGIGYIKLEEFTQDAGRNVREAFLNLRAENPDMKGLILDLRGNGGGLLNEAVNIVNIFVKRGELVVETKGKVAARNQKNFTTQQPVDTEIPVAVLIDGYSASASEIVSGSLQDFDRAVIVGSRSFGKGLVQNVLPMDYNTQMKVTVAKYYIPSGRCIQAIDYSTRDENGRAVKVPDSLKSPFLTKHGRTVYDGFGIEPDVEVEVRYMSRIAMVLVQKFLIFDYATHYYATHEAIPAADQFAITDEIYNDFRQFLKDKSYEYTTETEEVIKELRESAKFEQYEEALSQAIAALEAQVKEEKSSDLDKHRDEVAELIKGEILSRYYYAKGRIQGSLADDPEVAKAVEVLSDTDTYKRLLTK